MAPPRPRLLRLLAASAWCAAAAAQAPSFARDVLPILSDRCFTCHGPDAAAREADLRLDERDSMLTVVEPGAAKRSAMIARITSRDPGERMPPPSSNLSLTAAEVATLERWIDAGAQWDRHWAFVAPAADEPPAVRDVTWPRSDLDRFVLAGLEARGQSPQPPAAPGALLRRVTLDLTGLPPTVAELDAFVADPSDDAYLRVVDRLLASARYGERMAWPWLEAARYADTDGYQADPTRTAWPWRDWLVRALNDNLPFDRFTLEVLAGDLLPDATDEQRLATAFLRHNAHNGEGGRIPAETRVENVFDRTETVATVWMGLTFECARCHDHKYDPLPQRDYYRLFAFFDQTSETGAGRRGGVLAPAMEYIADPSSRARGRELAASLRELDRELLADDPALDARQDEWERRAAAAVAASAAAMQPSALGEWQRSAPFRGPEGELFAARFAPEADASWDGWQAAPALVDGRPLALEDGRYATYFRRTITSPDARRMTASFGSDDAIKVWCNAELVLENDVRRGVRADQERGELSLRAGDNVLLIKVVNTGGAGGVYFRCVDETVPDLPAAVARALLRPAAERDAATGRLLRRAFRRAHVDGYADRERRRDELARERATLRGAAVTVSVMDELPRERRRTTRVLGRGSYLAPGEQVAAGTPACLPPLPDGAPVDCLALARWLVSGSHPLTARVAVNRAWQTLFGRGLVATSEDFGRQGERPSHPRLLDWLARGYVASGWDTKALHRLIVTSATYRQASSAPREAFVDDPFGERLGRSPRPRLPAWMLRDQALALGGRLVERVGGPPVRPYQPAGVWAEATFDTIRYARGRGDDLYRRSLYVFWRRIVGPTVLFDTPARQNCVVRRATTNTPLHALTTLNETGFVESARGFAERAWQAGDDDARLRWLFRAATARRASDGELDVLRRRLQDSRRRFAAAPDAARALLAVGDASARADVDPVELAALTVTASLVLNLDEVLTRP